jgi:hypothetical protein
MAPGLSAMPRPETLLEMRSVRSPPDWKSRRPLPPTQTHSQLPAVTSFQGGSEYSMDLMARIDTPLFHNVAIRCFHPLIFSISQPAPLFGRTTKFKASYHPYSRRVRVILPFTSTDIALWNILAGKFSRGGSERQAANLRQRRKLPFRLRCRFVPRPVSPFHLMLLSHLRGSISMITLAIRLT